MVCIKRWKILWYLVDCNKNVMCKCFEFVNVCWSGSREPADWNIFFQVYIPSEITDQALASLRIETKTPIVRCNIFIDQALASLRIETEDNSEESGESGSDQALASLRIETCFLFAVLLTSDWSGSREPADWNISWIIMKNWKSRSGSREPADWNIWRRWRRWRQADQALASLRIET